MFCFYGHGVHRYLHVVTHSCPTRRSSDLVPWLIGHSRRTMGIIRQNIGISLATKALFVSLTDFGMASMWGAIAADVGVSLVVVANALRLLNAKARDVAPPSGDRKSVV